MFVSKMNHFPSIKSLATVVPPHVLEQSQVALAASQHFSESFGDFSRLAPIFANAGISKRYSCVPLSWYGQPHSFREKNEKYVNNSIELLAVATKSAMEQAQLGINDIDGIVVVSSTGIATPSLDALLIDRLNLRRDIARLPIFGLGCVGGVIGLSRTAALALAEPHKNYLFLVVELCGLTFRNTDFNKSNFVATALFGDGAAAAVVGCGAGIYEIMGWGEHTWPNSLDVMGWQVCDDGLGVLFSQDIPNLVRSNLQSVASAYLDDQGLSFSDIDTFICHPGGPKVLSALEDTFGLPMGGLRLSRDVLNLYGNMSAATVLFVLNEIKQLDRKGIHLMSALGPGFTCGFLTLKAS